MRLSSILPLLFPAWACAEPVQIPGPEGLLEAERIAPEGATDAVIIIPGSGPVDRDGNGPEIGLATDTYKLLAEGLARHGIASLRIDKRGFYGSAAAIGDPNNATIAAYAQDTLGWVQNASSLAPCVWIAGHSEGGLVALVAAQDAPDNLCGLILMSTAGRPIGKLMLEQLENNPANAPLLQEISSVLADLEIGKTRDTTSLTPVLQPLFSPGLQRYMIDLFSYDPIAMSEAWHGPTLIVQGDADMQVRPYDADQLENALAQAHRLDLKGGTHMLKTEVAGDPLATYRDPTLPLHDDLVTGIASFIQQTSNQSR